MKILDKEKLHLWQLSPLCIIIHVYFLTYCRITALHLCVSSYCAANDSVLCLQTSAPSCVSVPPASAPPRGHHRPPSWAPYAVHLPTSTVLHVGINAFMSSLVSQFIPPSPLPTVSTCAYFYPFISLAKKKKKFFFFENQVCGETGQCPRVENIACSCSFRTYVLWAARHITHELKNLYI